MKAKNLLIITAANIRMNYKYTILPSALLLAVIPLLYGTANLNGLQSADCLERMASLIGIPMFTALVRQEHSRVLYETAALRPISLRFIVALRICLSVTGTLLSIFLFEIYMKICGCSFPFFPYAFRTLAVSMALGLTGLFWSSILQTTVCGYLSAFCFYFIMQAENLKGVFCPVTNGIQIKLIVFLVSMNLAVICFCKPVFHSL